MATIFSTDGEEHDLLLRRGESRLLPKAVVPKEIGSSSAGEFTIRAYMLGMNPTYFFACSRTCRIRGDSEVTSWAGSVSVVVRVDIVCLQEVSDL